MRKNIVGLIFTVCAICTVFMSVSIVQASDFDMVIPIVASLLEDGYAEAKVSSLENAKAICHDIQVYIDAVSVSSETRSVTAKFAENSNILKISLKAPQAENFTEEELETLYDEAGSSTCDINNFITDNLSYDYDSAKKTTGLVLSSPSATAKGSLSTGKAVCQGYANLFALLAEHAGIQNVKVRGRINNVYHVLNVVRTEKGSLMAVDVTTNDSLGRDWSLITFSDYCAKINFVPEVDVDTAFALKYPA